MKPKKPIALWLLACTVFVLCAAPRAGYKVGSAPLYLVDFLVFATAVFAIQLPRPRTRIRSSVFKWVWIYIVFIVIGQSNVALTHSALLEPAYIFVRFMLAFMFFWEVLYLVRSPYELGFVLKFASAGIIVTGLITIGVSLPPTRGLVQNRILSNKYLEPADVNTRMNRISNEEKGTRGRSLIGASTMTGGFLNAIWPVSILLVSLGRHFRTGKSFLAWHQYAIVLGGFATIFTYARGAILGLMMSSMVILAFGKSDSKRNLLLFVLGAAIFIGWIGVGSDMFYFDRVAKKTEVLMSGDFTDDNEAGRIHSFTQPALYLMYHPESIVLGQGNTRGRYGQNVFAHHFTIAAAYHSYGLIAAIAFLGMYIGAILAVRWQMKVSEPHSYSQLHARLILVSLVGILPWLIFGHAAASMPRGFMMFMFIIALALLGNRFVQQEARTNLIR